MSAWRDELEPVSCIWMDGRFWPIGSTEDQCMVENDIADMMETCPWTADDPDEERAGPRRGQLNLDLEGEATV